MQCKTIQADNYMASLTSCEYMRHHDGYGIEMSAAAAPLTAFDHEVRTNTTVDAVTHILAMW